MSELAETRDKLSWLMQGYNRKKEYFENDRNRWIESAKIYWGVDYSQWPMQVVQQLLEEGRQAPTFNIMAYKLDGLRGSLLRNQFDMKYTPVSEDADDWALKLQAMWYSDKDTCNWDYSYDNFLRDFLIQYGVEWMYIDTLQGQNPFGNISFRPGIPYNTFPDPQWKSMFHKDLKEVDVVHYYTANELKLLYPDKKKQIEESYLRQKYATKYQNASVDYNYPPAEIGPAWQNLERRWGAPQIVIERHAINEEVRDWEYNLRDGEWFPETGYSPQSMDDITSKKHYIEQRGLTENDIKFIPQRSRKYHVTSAAPTLDIELEDKDSIIQIGWIPCFITGPAKLGTQFRGLADLSKDIQLNINKYMMMMSEILNRAARGGMFINEDIVQGDRDRMSEVERQWNNSGARIWVKPLDPNMIDKYVKEIPSAHIPNDLMSFHNLMNEYSDKLTFQPAAAEGRTESAKESGKLYQSKFEAHMIARGTIDTMLQMHEHSKAEAYLAQSKITYSGVPRSFSARDNKGKFEINSPKPEGMEWDISQCGRHKVVIVPSQKGVDVRINQRGIYMELKNSTRDPLMAAIYDSRIVGSLEMPEGEKEEAKMGIELVKKEAAMAKMLNIKQMEMQLQQFEQPPEAAEGAIAGAEGALPPGAEGQPGPEPGIPMTQGKTPNIKEGVMGTPLQGSKVAKASEGSVPKAEERIMNIT